MILASLLAVAAIAGRDTARADSVVSPWWEIAATASVESFASRLAMWQWHTVSVKQRTRSSTNGVELFTARRAGVWNAGFALEATRALSRRGYVVARGQFAPGARVIARRDLSVDGYHAIGGGWELAASARTMIFSDASVPILTAGIGRYAGLWYLRSRVSRARMRARSGYATIVSARRYWADASPDFIEFTGATGHEITPLSPTVVDLRRTTDVVVRGQKIVARGIGASLALTYSTNESLPDRRGITLGAFRRW